MNLPLTPSEETDEPDVTGLTSYSAGIVRLAVSKGLRPVWDTPKGHARRLTLVLPDGADGAGGGYGGEVQFGKRSGKVLRAEVIHGNDAKAPRRATGTNAVRALLMEVTPSACSQGCNAESATACRP